ncbi:ATP-binding cassette sub-family C member 4-like [Uranotaenia lowii]|uniref:ATP-binding cassette sub-family C member 4-like n=1 Tax=Uranotaenia lowii TaxID=190385 RepID=UPI00247B1A9B|nr:ATP-binding cassette sub-family C member 4-like [Uranotaenia lowii]
MEAPKVTLSRNPRKTAGLLSHLTFWWTIDMFRKGSSRTLELSDIYQPLDKDRSEKLGDELERNWNRQLRKASKKSNGRPSLIRAVSWTFWRDWLLLSVITFFSEIVLRIAQPILLGRLLLYFRRQSDISYETALYYALGMVVAKGASIVMENQYSYITSVIGIRTKIAICSVVYRKSMRLSQTALGDTSPGKVVNLLSNDVNRFEIVAYLLNYMWVGPLVTLIVLILIWVEVGFAGIIGIAAIFIVTPIQSVVGKLTSKYRLRTALRTDERIRLMDEVISGIHVIKMYAWERPFAALVSLARKAELKVVLKSGYLRGFHMTFELFTIRFALLAGMVTLVLSGEEITAAKVFVMSSYLQIVSFSMAGMFVRGVAEIAEGLVATRRIQRFLEYEEIDEYYALKLNTGKAKETKNTENNVKLPPNVSISLQGVSARWKLPENKDSQDSKIPLTLNNLTADFPKGKLIGIVGPIGSGKSSLLQAILRELPLEAGRLQCSDSNISFVNQEPWLFAGSIKQNILFGQQIDRALYAKVIKACAIQADLLQFPDRDETLIGERGISLSGGQKARICLARAIYKQSGVYLLDDPLSAVDAHVARHLFDLCIGPRGFLGHQHATRILVTHQVHFLVDADWVIVMDEGKIAAQGTPHDLIEGGKLNITEPEVDAEEQQPEDDRKSTSTRGSARNSVSSLSSKAEGDDQSKNDAPSDKKMQQAFEQSSANTVGGSLFMNYLSGVGSWTVIGFLLLLIICAQTAVSFADYWVAFWVSQEELRAVAVVDEEVKVDEDSTLSTDICLTVQTAAVIGIFVIGMLRGIGFFKSVVRASQTIHDWSFGGLIAATKYFFDTNPSGRILNRFAKDMGAMDEPLPKSIFDATQRILMIVGAMIVILVVQPLFIIPMLVLLGVLLLTRRIYVQTSQNSRRLESITRSPIFSHISTTLHGLSTIRSFAVQDLLISEFDQHQNLNTGALYMFHDGRVAFGFVLDLIFFVFLTVVTFGFLLIPSETLGDKVGLVVTQITSLAGMLQFGVRQSAEVFNHLIAVERLLEYRYLPPERQPSADCAALKNKDKWPSEGSLKFEGVNFRYNEGSPLVLRDLNFTVKPKEKIGIVGRTGAGKSSIIGALFRTAIVEGKIVIDGIDTNEVTLETLRSGISIIPQDPILFSGTLRKNLDPFERYTDSDLWNALTLVELKDIAKGSLGLHSYVANGGSNYSVGQRQLICLARAILRNNKILVLDEATANVDPETDQLIQRTIRDRFAACTVLTVAHRLNTIMDYDRILVMSDGSVVEFGTPVELLQISDGVFKSIVSATGATEAEALTKIAQQKAIS